MNFPKGPDILVKTIVLAACLSFSGSWLWAQWRGLPVPYVHDEFSYLLGADTFAHGRLANPAHPMRQFFQTFYVLRHPTYMSMYPPGQSAFMAMGQKLWGQAIYGVWLSTACMCGAIGWMLYAWMPPRWALVGGLVAVLQFGVFTYWSQSFWGGAVAATGGALIFGALPRLFQRQRVRDAVWLGLGCALLFNSRPLEGFLTVVPVAAFLLRGKMRWSGPTALALGWVLLLTAAGTAVYNKHVTGNAMVFPYVAYSNTSMEVPLFLWQPLTPVKIGYDAAASFEKNFREGYYTAKKTWPGFWRDTQHDLLVVGMFFLGFPLAIPALGLAVFSRRLRQAVLGVFIIVAAICMAKTTDAKPHFFSALTGLAVLWITLGLRGLACLKLQRQNVGRTWMGFLLALQLTLNIILTPAIPWTTSLAREIRGQALNLPRSFSRQQLQETLLKQGGKYVVFVRYPPWHSNFWEWVNNPADIDQAQVVWAHDLGPVENVKLTDYFKDRKAVYIQVTWDRPMFLNYHARQ